MKNIIKSAFIFIFLLVGLILPGRVYGWFGAGQTPGWPATTSGLTGQIALPEYKFSPDFYLVGDTVSINVKGTNLTSSNVTSHYYLAISRVIEAPIGTNITDGNP